MPIRVGVLMSCKYLYYQQLTSALNHRAPQLTAPKWKPLNGLPESRICCWLLFFLSSIEDGWLHLHRECTMERPRSGVRFRCWMVAIPRQPE